MIICIGIAVFDLVFDTDHKIQENKKNQAIGVRTVMGGNGVNVAKVLNYYQVPVQLISVIGNDIFGTMIANELKSLGIHFTENKNFSTPISTVINNTSNGSRTIINYKPLFEGLPITYTEHCELIYADGRYPIYTQKSRDQFPLIPIVWDWERYIHYTDNRTIVRSNDILICSEEFIKELQDNLHLIESESVAHLFDNLLLEHIIITKGMNGVLWYSQKTNPINISAIQVNAIDTNGAGDVFHALFINYFLKTKDISYSLKQANYFTGIFVSKQGFIEALPILDT
ncbi:MAG: carbohydrate kinase family protein [Brevinema sp.]